MGWALGALGVILMLLIVVSVTAVICKRFSLGWRCEPRDVWTICEEWRRKFAWLWAAREEKVGLVKAQQPTSQAVPGLYRQSSTNSSQYIFHSDSDLRLDAKGAFTRFEAVDRDLHPPVGQDQKLSKIPPQPLRPAPQPRLTARPRPSPLRPMTSIDYLRMQECEPGPLTPPLPPAPGGRFHRSSHFFQADSPSPPPLPPAPNAHSMAALMFRDNRTIDSESPLEEARKIRYSVQGAALSEQQLFDAKEVSLQNDKSPPYGSYDIVHDSEKNYDSIYDAQDNYMLRLSNKHNLRDLERITRYIQSLPDIPENHDYYEPMDEEEDAPSPAPPDREQKIDSPEPTTGEKIFKALRAVTSQSYIDASEFYNSILSSAQHVQNLAFNASSIMNSENLANEESNKKFSAFDQSDLSSRAADLYSPELNQEAHRTAQQVYNSLQGPPTSPLFLNDFDQQAFSYLSDPCFTRTSEDIFNSLEHHRKNSEEEQQQQQLNEFQEQMELESCEFRRNSQELLNAMKEVHMKRRLSQILDDCEGEDTEEMLVHSRRDSVGPELEPPLLGYYANFEDLSCLQHAVSFESLCSDTSVALNDLDSGKASVVGMVCIGLEHDRWPTHTNESDLIVSVLEARDLITEDGRPAQHTFARVCLLPDRQTYMQTRLYKDTNSPSYQEKFYFPLDGGPIGRTLLVEVFSYEMVDEDNASAGGEAILLGEASLRLGPTPRPPATTWLVLISSALPVPHLGEIMFSLSYLPTAERLTLVVVKARNLRGSSENPNDNPGDFFVKVYLLQQDKKMHKKRTSIKKGEKSPIFNEAIIFHVPPHSLQNIQLRVTVAEVNGELGSGAKAFSVGHVIVGATTVGRSLVHWRQMLAALRRPVAMWHPLRK